jgi:hypothetical protein
MPGNSRADDAPTGSRTAVRQLAGKSPTLIRAPERLPLGGTATRQCESAGLTALLITDARMGGVEDDRV